MCHLKLLNGRKTVEKELVKCLRGENEKMAKETWRKAERKILLMVFHTSKDLKNESTDRGQK